MRNARPTEAEIQRYFDVKDLSAALVKAMDDAGLEANEATHAMGTALGFIVNRARGHEVMVDNAAQIARMCLTYPSYYNSRPDKPLPGHYLPGAEDPCKKDARVMRQRLPVKPIGAPS